MEKASKAGLNQVASISVAAFLWLCLNAHAQTRPENLLIQANFDDISSANAWGGLAVDFEDAYGFTNFFRYDPGMPVVNPTITTDQWLGANRPAPLNKSTDNVFANVSQIVDYYFVGDQEYHVTVSAWYNTPITTGSYDIFTKFVFYNKSGDNLLEIEPDRMNLINESGSGVISLYDGSFTTPANTTAVQVLFFANEFEADDYLQLDDLVFTAIIPEPSSDTTVTSDPNSYIAVTPDPTSHTAVIPELRSFGMLIGLVALCHGMASRRRTTSRCAV